MTFTLYINGAFPNAEEEKAFVNAAVVLVNDIAPNVQECRLDTFWNGSIALPTAAPDPNAWQTPPVNATPDEYRAWLAEYDKRSAEAAAASPPANMTPDEMRAWLAEHDAKTAALASGGPAAGGLQLGAAPAVAPELVGPPPGASPDEMRAWLALHDAGKVG